MLRLRSHGLRPGGACEKRTDGNREDGFWGVHGLLPSELNSVKWEVPERINADPDRESAAVVVRSVTNCCGAAEMHGIHLSAEMSASADGGAVRHQYRARGSLGVRQAELGRKPPWSKWGRSAHGLAAEPSDALDRYRCAVFQPAGPTDAIARIVGAA